MIERLRHSSLAIKVTLMLLVVTALIPCLTWFDRGHIIFRGDPVMAFDPVRYFHTLWSLWPGNINLGAEPAVTAASLIHQFIQALPAFFGASDRTSEIWHFSFWFVLPGITMLLFMRGLVRRQKISDWAIPVAVSFYLYNLYRVAIFGDNNHFVVYATLPLLLHFIALAFENEKDWLRPAIYFALSTLLAAQAGTNPPMYLMLWLAVAIYGGVLTVVNYRQWQNSLKFWLTAAVLTVALNAYWMVPFLQILFRETGLNSAGNLDWLGDVSRATSLPHVIRLMGAWSWYSDWRGEVYVPYAATYAKPLWQNLTLIPIYLAAVGFFFRRAWNRYVLALLTVGLLGLAFSQGVHPPFGPVFHWSVYHLPFFWIFRSPWYKFTNLTAFAMATLIGLGVGYLTTFLAEQKVRPAYLALFVASLVILPLIIAHPLVDGTNWLRPKDVRHLAPDLVSYPTEIRQAADWLNSQPGDSAVALLPYQGSAVYYSGLAAPIDPIYYMSRRPIFFRGDRIGYVNGDTKGATTAYHVFVDRLYSDDPVAASQIAHLLGIEYIAERRGINYRFYDDHDSPNFVKSKLFQLSGIKLVNTFGSWDIYQLPAKEITAAYATTWAPYYEGHPLDSLGFYLTHRENRGSVFPAVLYTRPINQPSFETIKQVSQSVNEFGPVPTLDIKRSLHVYKVSGNADQPFILVLNQSFDPGWLATSKNATIGARVVANGYAPAWLIRPSGQFNITIEYRPQRLVLPLTLLSGLTVLALISYLVAFKRRMR